MDLSRLPALAPQPPASAQPTRDVTAAQRAFFRAALGVAEPAAPAPLAAATPAPTTASVAVSTPDLERPLRPGSIIDIRV